MHVHGKLSDPPNGGGYGRTDGDVGDEVPVHHVDVDPVRAGGFSGGHVVGQAAEISRENRRCDLDGHPGLRSMTYTPSALPMTTRAAMSRKKPLSTTPARCCRAASTPPGSPIPESK